MFLYEAGAVDGNIVTDTWACDISATAFGVEMICGTRLGTLCTLSAGNILSKCPVQCGTFLCIKFVMVSRAVMCSVDKW